MTKEIRLKSSSFSVISLETIDTGVTIVTIKQGGESLSISLFPEELGILLTSFGNSIVDGRAEELKRLQEHNLKMEKRKVRKVEKT